MDAAKLFGCAYFSKLRCRLYNINRNADSADDTDGRGEASSSSRSAEANIDESSPSELVLRCSAGRAASDTEDDEDDVKRLSWGTETTKEEVY